MGFSRQEYWSGVPLPSPTMEYYSTIKMNAFESVPMRQMNLEPIIQSEVKSERKIQITYRKKVKVTQSCPTLCNLMDYTVRGILQARILEWVAFPFSRGSSKPRDQTDLLYCRQILYQLSHNRSPRILDWVAYPFSSRSLNIVYWHIYMESRKMVLMNLFSGQQWRKRHKEQTYGYRGRGQGRGWDVWRQ